MAHSAQSRESWTWLRRNGTEFLYWSLAILWICAFAAIGIWVIVDMRCSAWHEARTVSRNILDVSTHNIARDIELYDLSIRAVVERAWRPDVMALPPDLRRDVVFDHSSAAKGLGRMHYDDDKGNIVDTSFGDPNGVNIGDRDYFLAHKYSPDRGLFIGKPVTGRIGKERYLVLSRRLNNPDGSFAGTVVGQIKLDYLRGFFKTIHQSEGGQIGLYGVDGTVYVREPQSPSDRHDDTDSIQGTDAQRHFANAEAGEFKTPAADGEPERMHVFHRIRGTNLVLDVAVASDAVLAEWRSRSTWMGIVLAGLVGTLALLVFRNQRELARRRVAEREAIAAKREALRLSETDSLTGLANRRMYDRYVAATLDTAVVTGESVTLAILDVDHFKRLNDGYGHAVGDTVLAAIGGKLSGLTQRSGELACRIGGEEFAVVLPGSSEASASRWGEVVRAAVADMPLDAALGAATVTISIGLAEAMPGEAPTQLMVRADAALYEAKRRGRNTVAVAGPGSVRAKAA